MLTLESKIHRVDNVWSFRFQPEHPMLWLAGQFMRVELPHADVDAAGASRWFTIAAAPHEAVPTITTRLTNSTFKQALANLRIGDHLRLLESPAGNFVWRPSDRPRLFAAQGIGITPFYAIIKDRRHHGLPTEAVLVYAHRPGTGAVFDDELQAWAESDPTLTIIHHAGLLSPEQLVRYVPDYAQRTLYVSGPKSFIRLCMPPHRLPPRQLKQDNFPGYAAANY